MAITCFSHLRGRIMQRWELKHDGYSNVFKSFSTSTTRRYKERRHEPQTAHYTATTQSEQVYDSAGTVNVPPGRPPHVNIP
ncbi:hypothetical protein J6590_025476 [Homalodisca vitripennis]|nr:hypothetical protein J6590_025476 [Homalodisca vitripennis]